MTDTENTAAARVDALSPIQYLILEVLAARHRTGERVWTFPSRLRPSLLALAEVEGLIGWKAGPQQGTALAWLTDVGRRAVLDDRYAKAGALEDTVGVGSDGNAPTTGPAQPLAAEQAEPDAPYARNVLRGSEAVPEDVRRSVWSAVNTAVRIGLGLTTDETIDSVIAATWHEAHRLFGAAIAYELTCLNCANHVDQHVAERAAGIEEGIRAAADFVADAAQDWTGETQRTTQIIAGRVRDLRAHDAAEPMHIAGYQPDPTSHRDAAGHLVHGCSTEPVTEPPPQYDPANHGPTCTIAYIHGRCAACDAIAERTAQMRPAMEKTFRAAQAFAERRLDAPELAGATITNPTLDQALALLHDVLGAWEAVPTTNGEPPMWRVAMDERFTEWRQRLTAIEEAARPRTRYDLSAHDRGHFYERRDVEEADRA